MTMQLRQMVVKLAKSDEEDSENQNVVVKEYKSIRREIISLNGIKTFETAPSASNKNKAIYCSLQRED